MLPESTCGDVRDDTAAFVRQLRAYAEGAKVHGKFGNRPPENPVERVVEDMFDWSAPVFVARAPGRLDVMGGIADYSGSLVLQMPIAEACHVAVQFRNLEEGPMETKKSTDRDRTDALGETGITAVVSLNANASNASNANATHGRVFRSATSAALTHLGPRTCSLTRDDAKMTRIREMCAGGENAWAAYPLGVLAALEHALMTDQSNGTGEDNVSTGEDNTSIPSSACQRRQTFPGFGKHVGVAALVSSAVPEGAGVSSSAALETAVAHAACAALAAYLPDAFVKAAVTSERNERGTETTKKNETTEERTKRQKRQTVRVSRRVFACDEAAGAAIARWCQAAEHFAADAPCGIMDQMAVGLGEANALLALLCRPAEVVRRALPLPRGVRVWGIDSGNAHSVGGGDYGATRAAAFMCRAAVAESRREVSTTQRRKDDALVVSSVMKGPPPLTALVTPKEFDAMIGAEWLDSDRTEARDGVQRQEAQPLPPLGRPVRAAAFLKRYPGGHGDDGVTALDPTKTYDVTRAGRHPVLEHDRVRAFYDAIVAINDDQTRGPDDADADETETRTRARASMFASLSELGASMFASHASYGALGLGDAGTDAIVGMVRDRVIRGYRDGDSRIPGFLFGAKITGGGSGGTVCVLGADFEEDGRRAEAAVDDVRAEYARARREDPALASSRETDAAALPHLFRGSSPGAVSYGTLALRLDGE